MRLTAAQIDTIKSTAKAVLGEGAQVTLFGSRVHDTQKGGDVDLYVETTQPDLMKKIRCKVSLQDQLDMPVDLIVKSFGDCSPIADRQTRRHSTVSEHMGKTMNMKTIQWYFMSSLSK